jgi:hypothetical protein
LGKLQSLEELNTSRCLNVTDIGMLSLVSAKLKLKKLNISSMIQLTSKSVNLMIASLINSIEDLDISLLKQKDINQSAVSSISKCSLLTHVNLAGMNIDDATCLNGLTSLQSVNISSIPGVTDDFAIGIIHLKVKVLRMSNCLNLTNELLDHILRMEKCNLFLLEINRTPKITDDMINNCLEKYSPNLRIIRSTNIIWDPQNIGLKIPLKPIDFEKPFLKGMKKVTKKKPNDKNPIAMYEKFLKENTKKTVLDYFKV